MKKFRIRFDFTRPGSEDESSTMWMIDGAGCGSTSSITNATLFDKLQVDEHLTAYRRAYVGTDWKSSVEEA